MLFLKRIGIVLLCMLLMFGIYYGSYRFYLYKYGDEDKEKFADQLSNKTVEANQGENNTITQRTKLTVEHYNRLEGSLYEQEETMPVEYIGMSREELTDYLEAYAKEPSLRDVEEGFEKYQILSFSPAQVVLRKISTPAGTRYNYYLTEENGCVTVYYIDKRTVFEYTNIIVDMLPEDIQEQVKNGKYVKDEDALYDFLETYTS